MSSCRGHIRHPVRGALTAVRRVAAVAEATGFGHGDHVCWRHDGAAAWRPVLAAFLHEGVERGERLLYTGSGTPDDLIDDLEWLTDRDRLLAVGALEVQLTDGAGGARDEPGRLRRAADDAVAAGYTGLRCAREISAGLGDGDTGDVVELEMQRDRVVAEGPITALCGYDHHRSGAQAEAMMHLVHPLRAGTDGSDYCWLTADGDRWRLSGALDVAHAGRFAIAMATLPPGNDVEIELDGVEFVDVAGTRALLQVAASRPGAELVLRRPGTLRRRLLEVTARTVGPELAIDGDDARTSLRLRERA